MNMKLNIYPKDKNRKMMKEILLLGIASISFIAIMTFSFVIANPKGNVIDIVISITGIWISITILFFSVNKWRKLGNLLIGILSIGIALLSLGNLSYHAGIISDEGKKAIQETTSYDALQNCETDDYQMVVLDDRGGKDVRYYNKKDHQYHYYHVTSDLSIQEVHVTETAFLPRPYKGE